MGCCRVRIVTLITLYLQVVQCTPPREWRPGWISTILTCRVRLLSDRNKILNDEQRRQRNNPQIKIDNAENSLFPEKNEMYNDK